MPTVAIASSVDLRSTACSPPPTTSAASTASSTRSARPTCRFPRRSATARTRTVTGAPFYVMEFVEGIVLNDVGTALHTLDEAARRNASDTVVDAHVSLHAVDVDAVGLGDLARRDDYIGRQLRRWHRPVRADCDERPARSRTGLRVPVGAHPGTAREHDRARRSSARELHHRRARHRPRGARLGAVHARRSTGRHRVPARDVAGAE